MLTGHDTSPAYVWYFNYIYCMRPLPGILTSFFLLLLLTACGKKDVPDPCLGVNYNFQYLSYPATGGNSNGSVYITSPGTDTVTFSINGGNEQLTGVFTGLAAGNYIVRAKSNRGCTDTVHITIPAYGVRFAAVRQLVNGYCGPCHLGGAVNGNMNFDVDASIVNAWDRIQVRTVTGTPSFMPQGGQLTTADKTKISDWVNAGHRITD